jgi:hypothetical protein
MSRKNGNDTLISWLHRTATTALFRHVKTTILTESYSNSGLRAGTSRGKGRPSAAVAVWPRPAGAPAVPGWIQIIDAFTPVNSSDWVPG